MFPWLSLLLSILVTVAAVPARAVSLLNGSVLTINGLNLTVSGCSLILAGVTQSSCAPGHLLLQGLSSGTGYTIGGDGTGSNGTDVLDALETTGLTRVSFHLSVSPVTAGSRLRVTSSALVIHGSVPAVADLSTISASEVFSAAAGGGTLSLVPSVTNNGSLSLTPANTFSISNTLAINTTVLNGWGTIQLSSVQQTFTVTPEPATISMLAMGALGLIAVRWRVAGRRAVNHAAALRGLAGRTSRPGSARSPISGCGDSRPAL